ncbi:MAG: PAS domain-containing sensor histidine kinase, partial [Candidatus Cloacimonetes bacterium]|nr:PAS domain-containing sensor histidine kinase [Candidatus Cloacimonadota bacterium]
MNIMEEKKSKMYGNPLLKPDKLALEGIGPGLLPNLMHNLPGMAFRCLNDAEWSMLFISEGCVDLTGYQVADLIDNTELSYNDLILEEDRQRVREDINDAVQRHTQYQIEYRIICKDGKIKSVWEKGNGVYDRDRNPTFLDGFIIDVSARILAEEELRQAAENLAELNATKDRFFSLLAHDLQNPVYAIISLSEFVAENYDNFGKAEIQDAFLQVNNAARGVFTLLENLLDWAKLQTGQIKTQKEIISITKTMGYAIEHYRKASLEKGIEIVFEYDEDCLVESDMRILSSIFRNLISNALKYSHPQSKIKVQLRSN